MCFALLKSSIGKKQIVAVTGLLLILFVVGHLCGNLLIYLGPDAFNSYAEALARLRPVVFFIEMALLAVFLTHVWVTVLLVHDNMRAAGVPRYAVANARGEESWATRLKVYTGLFIFAFVIWHLMDFTLSDRHGARAIMAGQYMGLYGVVYNSFLNPVHSALYILAMFCLGFHLAHGVQSFVQTFGFNHPKYTPLIEKISNYFGFLIAVGFSSIPVYVLIKG